jgi:hypothetical protein
VTVPTADVLRMAGHYPPQHSWLTEAADLLDAIDQLHQPITTECGQDVCDHCEWGWPCPTAQLLHPEEEQ